MYFHACLQKLAHVQTHIQASTYIEAALDHVPAQGTLQAPMTRELWAYDSSLKINPLINMGEIIGIWLIFRFIGSLLLFSTVPCHFFTWNPMRLPRPMMAGLWRGRRRPRLQKYAAGRRNAIPTRRPRMLLCIESIHRVRRQRKEESNVRKLLWRKDIDFQLGVEVEES